MKNYYKLLEISNNSTLDEIKNAYKYQINKLKKIEIYTEFHKKFLKELKIAKFILIDNTDLKEKYDIKLSESILETQKNLLNNKFKNHLIGERVFDLNTFKHEDRPLSNITEIPQKNNFKNMDNEI
jgi:DnaJ-class molecular chaperone